MIKSTLAAQFATRPALVSCLRVWPDRDRFRTAVALRPRPARDRAAAAREIATMAPGNVTPMTQPAQENAAAPIVRTIGLSDLHQALRLSPTVVDRLKAAGQVRHEVENAIERYVTVVAGRQLPPVNFLSYPS